MQHRMEKYGTTEDIAWNILCECENGMISTLNPDGSPYAVPVNHVCLDGMIYIHGRRMGTKIDNIIRDPRVCFTVCEQEGYEYEGDTACDTETIFRSAVVEGTARIIEDADEKRKVLRVLADRFGREAKEIPEDRIGITSVIEIIPSKITGKVHPWGGKPIC